MKRKDTFVDELCSILIASNSISKEEAAAMKRLFKDRGAQTFDYFLLQEGFVSKPQLLNALSVYYKVPAFDVVGYFFDHRLLKSFDKEVMKREVFIPVLVDEQAILSVVTDNPAHEHLLVVIGEYVSFDVECMVGLTQDILDAIDEFYDESPTVIHDQSQIDDETDLMQDDIDQED